MPDLKEWYNADGLKVRFAGYQGQRRAFKNVFVEVETDGNFRELICNYDLSLIPASTSSFSTDRNNDGTVDGFNQGDFSLPANAVVLSCDVYTQVAAAGGTSIEVGAYQENGTAITRAGFVTATEGVLANLSANKRVIGVGTLLADANAETGIGANIGYPGIWCNGTFTAGTGKIVLRYVEASS